MEISNDVLFMLAIILLFFCLMKDRPCNVEGLPSPQSSPQLKPSQYMVNPGVIFPNETGPRRQWFINQEPVDFRKCRQGGGKCIECKSIASLATGGCNGNYGYKSGQEYSFDLNSPAAAKKKYHYALTDVDDNNCQGRQCGIICDSQGPEYRKTQGVGFPGDQNGLFCKV